MFYQGECVLIAFGHSCVEDVDTRSSLCSFLTSLSFDNLVELCSIWVNWYASMCILQYYDLQSHIGGVSVSLMWRYVFTCFIFLTLESWCHYCLWNTYELVSNHVHYRLVLLRFGIVMALWFTADKNWKRCVLVNGTENKWSVCQSMGKCTRQCQSMWEVEVWLVEIIEMTKKKKRTQKNLKRWLCGAVWGAWDDMKEWYTILENTIFQVVILRSRVEQ